MPEKKAPATYQDNDPDLVKRAKKLVAKVLMIGVAIGVVGFGIGMYAGYSLKVKDTHYLEVDLHELREARQYVFLAKETTTLIRGAIEGFQTRDLKCTHERKWYSFGWKPEYALSVSYKWLEEAEDYLLAYEEVLSKQIEERWDEVRAAETKKLSESQ